jgi:hypothetical protein
MAHNQEDSYFAGRQKWDPCKLSWYDVQQSPDCSKAIWNWLNMVNEIDKVCVHAPGASGGTQPGYKGVGELSMIDGCGVANERWRMYGIWPQQVNWKELDYSNTEIALIEVTARFDRAVRLDK